MSVWNFIIYELFKLSDNLSEKIPLYYINILVTVAKLIFKTIDVVSSCIFYVCDINRTYNSILKMHWCCWFSYPELFVHKRYLAPWKYFSFVRKSAFLNIIVNLRSTITSPNPDWLVGYKLQISYFISLFVFFCKKS